MSFQTFDETGFVCPTCDKSYSTSSHLRRHKKIHTGAAKVACPFCNRSFARVDTARRHAERCSTDGADVTFPKAKPGKARQACDACSQRKSFCDAAVPCARCQSTGTRCTYKRLEADRSSTPDHLTGSLSSSGRGVSERAGLGHSTGNASIDFLLAFTDPLAHGPSRAILADNLNHASTQDIVADMLLPDVLLDNDDTPGYVIPPDLGDWFPGAFDLTTFYFDEDCVSNQNLSVLDSKAEADLAARMTELISRLSVIHELTSKDGSGPRQDFDVALAQKVFTVTSLRRFVDAYFHQFHGCNPLVHRPTFDMQTVSLPLLLALFLFGSQCSVPLDEAISAGEFFDLAEEYIFRQPIFSTGPQDSCPEHITAQEVEALQGGLIINMIQRCSKSKETRRRIRFRRTPCLVATTRMSGLFGAKHRVQDHSEIAWDVFLFDELCIRIGLWTFLSDGILALFFGSLPQVSISDMTGQLPCREDLFEAETAAEFQRLMSLDPRAGLAQSPFDLTLHLLSNKGSEEDSVRMAQITSASHLTVGIWAIISIVMTSRLNLVVEMSAQTILSATDKWKDLWNIVAERDFKADVQQSGLTRHTTAYWWLTRTFLKIVLMKDYSSPYMQNSPTDSVENLHNFIKTYRSL
ncbi:hypothetical protein BKA56DRAFT_605853 [Ilyonectria sp. MPI-CAGE-AT-0026]|nr:hypothetical protein BKA56DRAFT_605853 [Ilyonectria sp. MPI-CAGE-AT-0026]